MTPFSPLYLGKLPRYSERPSGLRLGEVTGPCRTGRPATLFEEIFMKLTRASNYALQALVSMAGQKEENQVVASHLTARDQGIPERFLLKILKPLVSAGVLDSLKGPNGGYRLAKPAAKITLLEVVEAVDGPIRGQAPLTQAAGAKGATALDRRLQDICQSVADQTRKQLGQVRLSELVGKGGAKKK
jgi:Rrf2 family protein